MSLSVRGQLSSRTDLLLGVVGLVAFAALWCALTYGGFVRAIFLPSPTGIIQGILDFHRRHWFFPAIWRSCWRVSKSMALVITLGVPVGLLMGAFPAIDATLRRLVDGAKSVPTTGIVGLIVLWFSIEEKAKIVFLFLGAIFYMIILVKNAVQAVDGEYVRVALDLGANGWNILRRVLLPGALPQIWDAIAVCNGIMWTYIVLAEFINSNEEQLGLGYLLQIGSRTQDAGKVFGVLLTIALVSSGTDLVLRTVRRRFLSW